MPDLPAILGGRYRPLRILGRGGMGVVYEVEHIHTRERLALKVLTSADRGRFLREARAFTSIKSEFVVRVTDADTAPELDGAPFLVMELLEGTDLATLLKTEGAQSPASVARLINEAAAGLARAHAAGITHRDLKPANLFLANVEGAAPRLKVLDFGVAKVTESDDAHTQSGAIVGTPRFMSPEQARASSNEVGPASDIWAIGMIAFTLLDGGRYFDGETMAQVIAQVLFDPIVPPSTRGCDLGAPFDEWFLRSCAREPDARFSSVSDQARALEAALSGVSAPLRVLPAASALDPTATSSASVEALARVDDSRAAHSVASVGASPRRSEKRWPILAGALLVVLAAAVAVTRSPAPSVVTGDAPASSATSPLPSADVVPAPSASSARSAEPVVSPAPPLPPASSAPPLRRPRRPVLPLPPDPFDGQK